MRIGKFAAVLASTMLAGLVLTGCSGTSNDTGDATPNKPTFYGIVKNGFPVQARGYDLTLSRADNGCLEIRDKERPDMVFGVILSEESEIAGDTIKVPATDVSPEFTLTIGSTYQGGGVGTSDIKTGQNEIYGEVELPAECKYDNWWFVTA